MRLIDVDALKKEWHMGDRCEECKRNARDCQYAHTLSIMDFCSILDDAPTVAKDNTALDNGWISVKDRMPNMDEDVVIYRKWVSAGGKEYTEIWYTNMREFLSQGLTPTAWIPLPELPKEEETNG